MPFCVGVTIAGNRRLFPPEYSVPMATAPVQLDEEFPLTDKRLAELSRMQDALLDRIFALRLDTWPFIELEGVK